MRITRRRLMKRTVAAAGALALGSYLGTRRSQPQILCNHVGLVPRGAKYCMASGGDPTDFEVISPSGQRVHQGRMQPVTSDLGGYRVGDFSQFRESGIYE